MNKLILISLSLLIGSCSAEKRCARINAKSERLGCLKTDSVIIKDTVITNSFDTTILHDTISEIDTAVVNNVTVITKWKTREQRIIEKADTIITERIVPRVIYKPSDCPKNKFWDKFWFGFVCGIGLILLILYLTKQFKK